MSLGEFWGRKTTLPSPLLGRVVIHFPTKQKILSQSNEDYGETKDMTREELLQLINKAADEGSTELDLAGLGLEDLPPEIGKCTQLETLVLGKVKSWRGVDGKWTPQPITNQLTSLP